MGIEAVSSNSAATVQASAVSEVSIEDKLEAILNKYAKQILSSQLMGLSSPSSSLEGKSIFKLEVNLNLQETQELLKQAPESFAAVMRAMRENREDLSAMDGKKIEEDEDEENDI